MVDPISVIVPAHDEAAVIDRCLDALLADAAPGELDVVVACNGCSDDTAARAARHGPDVRVVELDAPGKIGALNAGDAIAVGHPRVYLDADVVMTTAAVRATAATLARPDVLAAAPRPRVVTDRCPWVIAAHHRAWTALPVISDGYVGSGVYALSAEGHRRIAPFPDVIADDEYVRRTFRPQERATAPATFDFYPPRTVKAYLLRAQRGRAGNAQLDASGLPFAPQDGEGAPPSGLRGLASLRSDPSMWLPALAFVALTVLVRARVALTPQRDGIGWNRDATSREHAGGPAS